MNEQEIILLSNKDTVGVSQFGEQLVLQFVGEEQYTCKKIHYCNVALSRKDMLKLGEFLVRKANEMWLK